MVASRLAKYSLVLGMGAAMCAMGWMTVSRTLAQPTTAPSAAPATAPAAGPEATPATQASATTLPATQGNEISLEHGLKYVEVQPGQPKAQVNDIVWVHYTGTLEKTGKKFDSSYDHRPAEPLEFKLGTGMVIPGWDQGIQGMVVGEKRRLIIPPNLAYGKEGMGEQIPPNSTLIFDVELVGLARP